MCILLVTIIEYGILIAVTLFITWLVVIEIHYQNNQCFANTTKETINPKRNLSIDPSMIDQRLKLNHFTILGTHNSYHKANLFYKYEHPALDNQLSFGIRQIELDIHLMKNNLVVYHLQLFDDQTNCYCFKECLRKIRQWSNENQYHYPIYIFIEIKQMFYEDLLTGLSGGVKCEHLKQIRKEMLDVFSVDKLILPNDIQGNQTSVQLALKQQRQDELSGDYTYKDYGWPPLYQSLGKLIPVFLDDVHNNAAKYYSTCEPFRNFFLICQRNLDVPYASIITTANKIRNPEKLLNSINNGLMIRLLLGYGYNNLEETYQASKQYGIHIISSDSVQCTDTPLCQALANDFQNSNILCNNNSAPSFCNFTLSYL